MPIFHGFFSRTNQKGQAFLVVVLIMIIALTVGLSVASRTITNLKMGSEEENSQKAFSAAEAGIEQVLQTRDVNIQKDFTTASGAKILFVQKEFVGASTNDILLNNGSTVSKDEGLDIWFTPYDPNPANIYNTNWSGTFTLYWGTAGKSQCTDAAIELIVITGTSKSDSNLQKSTYTRETGCTTRSTGFTTAAAGNPSFLGENFPYSASFNLSNVLFARVIPIFSNTKVGVHIGAGPNFPSTGQGQLITSQGQSGSSQREVSYFETWDTLPSAFLFSVFSSQ